MPNDLAVLMVAAASIGFFHTLFGPDHYLPFVVMAKARKWSLLKTAWVTLLCGLGHVGSSVVLGVVGIAAGVAVFKLEGAESFRGDIAAWLLTAFGLAYFVWGLRRAIRNRPHTHVHAHLDGPQHEHEHSHDGRHVHVHQAAADDPQGRASLKSLTPWILFTIFVFGPCEPLIPLLMYPAAAASVWGLLMVTLIFAAATIGTMLIVVLVSVLGLNLLPIKPLERYTHAMAGATIFLCGISILFLGL